MNAQARCKYGKQLKGMRTILEYDNVTLDIPDYELRTTTDSIIVASYY